ncbi:hypothetical protein DERP_011150 [Dermatophagoides pteronyssinus]|uniref:Uncharacterized protein n=1 Tax=Dermatophagoides pteronyssinus TaxID=6956 RepID=A0ABQ8J9D8_DERPT|nr:hypothetical protein DERP_011150 [Dermatophagoides pteronyssinus]
MLSQNCTVSNTHSILRSVLVVFAKDSCTKYNGHSVHAFRGSYPPLGTRCFKVDIVDRESEIGKRTKEQRDI